MSNELEIAIEEEIKTTKEFYERIMRNEKHEP
jgi:hypothetical protein